MEEERNDIFNEFCYSIWKSDNKRRVYPKVIRFKVRKDLLDTEIGEVFDVWPDIEYIGYKSMTKETDWCSLIRQKVNNLYTRYFDKDVILKKEYMDLLKTPKRLYYQWINGAKMDKDELTTLLEDSLHESIEVKKMFQKQKMELSWNEYKKVIEEFFKKIFNNCKLIEDYETGIKYNDIYDFKNEDNFYIRYFCKCLEGEMLKWQKKYYKVRDHKKYKRCIKCGELIEIKTKKNYSTKYCKNCAYIIKLKQVNECKKRKRNKS